MSRMRLLREAAGQVAEGFCLVKSAAIRPNVKGVEYLDMVLADCDGECVAKLWDYSEAQYGVFAPEDLIKVRGTISLWKESEQLKVEKIRHALPDELDMSGIVPCSPLDPETLYDELYALADTFRDEHLKRLVQHLYGEHKDVLITMPAGVKLHHATRGGLLHHTWAVVRLAQSISALYPALDGDLLLAGCMLHDIGKLAELACGSLGIATGYTGAGQLVGHISIGVNMIGTAAGKLEVPEETAMLLRHMLLSHHGSLEFGSPKLPMFPEAEALSVCDLLDSKLYEMYAALESVAPGGFSERQWALDNRQLYQHGRTGDD